MQVWTFYFASKTHRAQENKLGSGQRDRSTTAEETSQIIEKPRKPTETKQLSASRFIKRANALTIK